MRLSLGARLACPDDGREVGLSGGSEVALDEQEVQEGHLICLQCGRSFPIVDGIPACCRRPSPLKAKASPSMADRSLKTRLRR